MNADDERHGTSAGYIAGCRDECCLRAKVRYDKQRRWELHTTGKYRKVPSFRVIRRIRALQALGWSVPQIAKRCDMSFQHLYMLSRHETAYVTTLETIVGVYDVLSMSLPPETNMGERIGASRARNHARRMGWPPPLAWSDIDDPDEEPAGWQYRPAARADNLRELVVEGAGITEACRRLHVTQDALEKWCERHGMNAEFRTLVGREGARRWDGAA